MTAIITPMLLFKAAIVVGSIAYQQRMQRKARREAQRAAEARKGFDLVVESEIIALGLPMGRFKVGGTRVFRNTANSFIYTTPNSDKQFLSGSPNVPAGTYEEIVSNEGGTTTVTVSYSAIDGSMLTKSISGSKNEYLFTQQALCVGPLTSIYDFLIDDSIDLNDPSIGSVAPPSGAINGAIAPSNNPQNKGALRIDVHYGNILKADAISSVNFATRAEAKFPGMSYASCVFKLDRDNPQFQNVPNVTFFGEGIKAPTVSNGTISTSLTYTTNPARLLLYYLLYVRGLSADEIDATSFESAQAICDRVVGTFPVAGKIWQPLDGSRNITTRQLPRFECNIVLDTNVPHRENYSQILSTMGDARLVRSGGKYKLKIQDPATNNDIQFAGEITEADIVKNNTIEISGPSSQDKLNHAVVRFLNESLDFKEDFASWPSKTNGTFFKGVGNAPYPSVDGWDDTYTGGKLLNTYGVWNSNSASASFSWKFLVKNTGTHILNFTADNSCTVTIKNSTYTHSNVNSFANITLNLTKDEIVTISATASNSNADGKFGFAGRILDSLNYIVWNSRSIIYTDFIQQTYSNSVYQTYFEEDSNVEAETDVFLNGVTTYQHALAHAEELVRTSRNRLSIKFTYWMLDKIYESGDFIKLNLPSYDINDLPIKIDTAKPNTDGSCEIVAESFDASNIAWNVGDDQIVSPRNYFNFNIPMPANLTVIRANIYLKDSSGRVEWSPSSDSRVKSHIIYVHRTGDKDSTGRPIFVEIGRSSGNTFDLPKLSFVSGMIGVRAVAGNSLSDMNVTESVLFNERTLALSQTASLFSKISSTAYDPATIQLTAITTGYLAPVYQWYEDNQLLGVGDQYFSNVSLLLHLDGSDNSTVFTDSSSNNVTVTAFNNAKLSTTQSKFGGSSAVFNNVGDWQNDGGNASALRADDSSLWDYGSGDFCIEAWVRLAAYPADSGGIVGKSRGSANFGEYLFTITSSGALAFGANTSGETGGGWDLVVLVSSASAVALNVWQHVAVTRSGTTFRLFVNGVVVATASGSGPVYNGTGMLSIGSNKDNGQFGFNGYIDEVRITKGVARYTANFTPPTSQFLNTLGNSSNTLTVNPFSAGVTKEYKVVVEEQDNLGDNSTLLSESVSIFSIDLSAASKNTIVLSPPSANVDYVPGIGISSNPSTQISVVDANGNDVTNNYNLSKVDSGLSTTINNNILTVNSIGNPDSAYGVFLARMNGVTDDEGPYSIKSSAMGTDVVISSTGGPLPNTGRAIFNGNNNAWGSGGSIVYPVPPEMMPTDSNISVSFWIKFDDVNQSVYQPLVTGFLRISFYGNNYISGWGPYMTFEILGSQPNVYNSDQSPTLFANVSTPNTGVNAIPWSSNTWYFIEGTYDKLTSKVYLFRDGIKIAESTVQPTNASLGFLYQRRGVYDNSYYTTISIGAVAFSGYSYGLYGSMSEIFIQTGGTVNISNYTKPNTPRLSVIPSSTNLSNIVATPKLSGSPINTNFYVYSTIKSGPVIDIIQSRSSGIVDADWDNSNQSYTSAAMSYRILVDGVDQTNLWQVRAAHDGQSQFMQMSVTPGNFSVNYKQNTGSMFVSFIVGRSGYKTQLFEYLVQTSLRAKPSSSSIRFSPSSVTLNADSSGVISDWSTATSQVSIVLADGTNDTANWTLSVTPSNEVNATISGTSPKTLTISGWKSGATSSDYYYTVFQTYCYPSLIDSSKYARAPTRTASSGIEFLPGTTPVGNGYLRLSGTAFSNYYVATWGDRGDETAPDTTLLDVSGAPWAIDTWVYFENSGYSVSGTRHRICGTENRFVGFIYTNFGIQFFGYWVYGNRSNWTSLTNTEIITYSNYSPFGQWVYVRFSYCADGYLRLWANGTLLGQLYIGLDLCELPHPTSTNGTDFNIFGVDSYGRGPIRIAGIRHLVGVGGAAGSMTVPTKIWPQYIAPPVVEVEVNASKSGLQAIPNKFNLLINTPSIPTVVATVTPSSLTVPATYGGIVNGTSATSQVTIYENGVITTNNWKVRFTRSLVSSIQAVIGNYSIYVNGFSASRNTGELYVWASRPGLPSQRLQIAVNKVNAGQPTVVAGGPSTLTIQASSQGIANNLPIQFSITALNSGVDEANQYLWTVTPEANSNLTFTNSGNSSTINLTGATNYSKDSFLVTITGTRSGWPNLVHTLTVNRIRAAQSSLTLSPQKSIVESDYYGNVVNWSPSTTTATVTAPSGANETSAWSYFIHAVNNVNATLDGAFNNRINITGFDLNTVNNNHKFYSLLIPGDENINDYSMYQRVFTADSNVTFESSGSPVGGGFVKVPPNRTGNFDQQHYAITYGIDTDPSFVDVSGQPWDLKMFLRVNTQPRSMTDYICQNSVITITVITSGTGVYIRALWTWRNKNQFSANQTTTALNSSTLSLNNWVEVRFSYCSDGLLRLWLDGVLQASSNIGQNKYHGQSGYYDNWNRTWYFGDYGHSGSGRIISFDFCEFYLAYGLSGPLTSSYSVQYSKIIPVNSPKSAFVTLRADKANEVSLYATTDISIVPKSQPSITISSQPTFLTLPATWDGVVTGSSATAVVTVLVDGVDDTANWGFVFDYDHNGSLGASISNSSIYLTTGSIFQTAIRVYASRPGFTTKMIKIPVSLSRGVQPTVISSGTTSIQVISDWDDTNRLNLPITCSVVALEGSTVVTSNYNWSISASSGITLNNYYGSSVNLIDMNSGINSGTITFTGSRTSWPTLSWRVTVSKLLNTQPIVLLSGTSSLQVQANWNDTDILNLPLLGSVVATDQSTGVIVTNNYTWTITASSGITANNSGSQFSITNMSSGTLSGTITMTATRSQWPTLTWTVQITKIFAAQPIVTLTGPTSATIAGATDGSVPSSSLPVSVSLTAVGPTTNENSNYIWSLTSTSGITANINNSAVVQITAINSNTDTGTITVTGTRTGWPSLVWYISVNKTRLLSPSGDAANWSADCFATAFSTATGRIIIKSDGTVVYKINQSAERYSTNWYTPTTIGIGNSRWMKYSVISGASPGVGSLAPNTLVQLTSDQTISLVQSGMGYTDGQYLVEIYSNSAGTTKVSEGTVYIVAEIS